MKKHTNRQQRGQALVESIFLIPVLLIIVSIIFWFARLMLTRQQLLMAARYGTDMIVYTNLNADQIRDEIRDYLCGDTVEGRKLDPKLLDNDSIKITINRQDKNAFRIYSFDEVKNNSSSVELFYKMDSPKLFSAFDKFIPGAKLPEKLTVSARSEVLAGTGCKGE